MAQLVAHLHGMQGVGSSSLPRSTIVSQDTSSGSASTFIEELRRWRSAPFTESEILPDTPVSELKTRRVAENLRFCEHHGSRRGRLPALTAAATRADRGSDSAPEYVLSGAVLREQVHFDDLAVAHGEQIDPSHLHRRV